MGGGVDNLDEAQVKLAGRLHPQKKARNPLGGASRDKIPCVQALQSSFTLGIRPRVG